MILFVDPVFKTYFFADFFVPVLVATVLGTAILVSAILATAIHAAADDTIRLTVVVIAIVWPVLPIFGASRLLPLLLPNVHSLYTLCPPPASDACSGSTS